MPEQTSLFPMDLPPIEGLVYKDNFISEDDEHALITYVDQAGENSAWDNGLKRQVQHYGYRYDYTARRVKNDDYLGPLPPPLAALAQRLKKEHYFRSVPNQVIVNEYLPGQGIASHIDCVPCFGEFIASLSLGSLAIMQFGKDGQIFDLPLNPRILLTLSGAARYDWSHGIPARKTDIIDGMRMARRRRISLTFRTMILP